MYFTDPINDDMQLAMDDTFKIGLTPVMFPDYQNRAIPLNNGEQVLHTFLLSPIDLVVSKLSRCVPDDVKDIIEIYKTNRFTIEKFEAAAQEALEYTATPSSLQPNIEHVIIKLKSVQFLDKLYLPQTEARKVK